MTEILESDVVLDLQGLACPIPIVKISKAISGIDIGQVVEATATDPGVLVDVPAWCRTTGNEMLKLDREGKTFRFWVKRVS